MELLTWFWKWLMNYCTVLHFAQTRYYNRKRILCFYQVIWGANWVIACYCLPIEILSGTLTNVLPYSKKEKVFILFARWWIPGTCLIMVNKIQNAGTSNWLAVTVYQPLNPSPELNHTVHCLRAVKHSYEGSYGKKWEMLLYYITLPTFGTLFSSHH